MDSSLFLHPAQGSQPLSLVQRSQPLSIKDSIVCIFLCHAFPFETYSSQLLSHIFCASHYLFDPLLPFIPIPPVVPRFIPTSFPHTLNSCHIHSVYISNLSQPFSPSRFPNLISFRVFDARQRRMCFPAELQLLSNVSSCLVQGRFSLLLVPQASSRAVKRTVITRISLEQIRYGSTLKVPFFLCCVCIGSSVLCNGIH